MEYFCIQYQCNGIKEENYKLFKKRVPKPIIICYDIDI